MISKRQPTLLITLICLVDRTINGKSKSFLLVSYTIYNVMRALCTRKWDRYHLLANRERIWFDYLSEHPASWSSTRLKPFLARANIECGFIWSLKLGVHPIPQIITIAGYFVSWYSKNTYYFKRRAFLQLGSFYWS